MKCSWTNFRGEFEFVHGLEGTQIHHSLPKEGLLNSPPAKKFLVLKRRPACSLNSDAESAIVSCMVELHFTSFGFRAADIRHCAFHTADKLKKNRILQ